MAAHEHKYIKVSDDDVVVISAHAIPGNESNVSRVIDSLHRAGAEVIHDRIAPVHVSGHASQEELKFLLDLVQPEWFVPVHGEYRHLVHHARLAETSASAPDHVLVCEDGDVLTHPTDGRAIDVERRAVPAGYQYVDGIVGDIGLGVLRDRRNLAEEGFVAVIVTVDASTGELVTGPEIVTRGWVYAPEAEELLEEAKAAVRESLARGRRRGRHRLRDHPPPRPPLARQVHQRAHPPPPRHHPGGHRGLIREPLRSGPGEDGVDLAHGRGQAFLHAHLDTRATWSRERPPPTPPSCWSTRVRASRPRPAGTAALSLLGVELVAVAINKLDLVGYDRGVFECIPTTTRQKGSGSASAA